MADNQSAEAAAKMRTGIVGAVQMTDLNKVMTGGEDSAGAEKTDNSNDAMDGEEIASPPRNRKKGKKDSTRKGSSSKGDSEQAKKSK